MKLKPWYQVVIPREDLRENRPLDAAEFAVHLDHIRDGRAADDYTQPERFFERTFLTKSLLGLASQAVRRLSGIQVETSAVFNMATQFGGGKSHSLTTLYHLAKGGDRAKTWQGVSSILRKADVPVVPTAEVAVFVGTEFDVLEGRGGDGEPMRKTPWGEIGWQLAGEKGFAAVKKHDEQGIAPAGDVIRRMLPAEPVLILMDELLNYVSRARKLGMRDQFFAFMQSLAEEARARNNMILCASIPKSDIEMSPEDVQDYASLKKLLDRLGKAVLMSADREMAEIIRRRLFEWGGLPEDGRRTTEAYAEWAVDHAQELVGIDPDTAYEKFKACYPFHPSVLSVFERKWQSLPKFQRTRGVLRLLALWVSHNYQEEHRKNTKEPLISLGLAPLGDPQFRAALFEQLGSDQLEVPVTTDILGKSDAHAARLDKEAADAIRKGQLHRKSATVIFFESNGGMSQARAEATVPEIRTATAGPEVNLADIDPVLEGLAGSCFYLNWERNRYRFGLVPNLNQILISRRGAVETKRIEERIRQETETLFAAGTKAISRRFWPKRTNDVPSQPVLTLVVLGLDMPAEAKQTLKMIDATVRQCGSAGRTFKSALLFAAPDPSTHVVEATRNLLAWEDIDDDEETKQRIDESQRKLLKRNHGSAKRDLKEALFRAYRHIYLLNKDNGLRHVDLGRITSSSATPEEGLVGLYVRELKRNDEITDGVSARRLVKYWPPSLAEWSTKGIRDAFYSSPKLPRLLNADAVKRTITDGVSEGLLALAGRDATGNLTLDDTESGLFEADLEISDEILVLKADDAQRLREPPRLAQLVIRPERATILVGQHAEFAASSLDQYRQAFPVPPVTWSAKGGQIDKNGLFTAGDAGGLYTIHAQADGIEAVAEIRINTKADTVPVSGEDAPEGKRLVHWRGTVPPQKWMNFYTKVLTRFASSPDLQLEVAFEIPLDREEAESKADEARSGLKELGLHAEVHVD